MTRFNVSKTLFGDWSVFYLDPISGREKSMRCNLEDAESIKTLILGKILRDLVGFLFKNRITAYNFLEKSNPHHISPGFRRAIRSLQAEVNAMYAHGDIRNLSSHIALRIIPDLLSKDVAPKSGKPEAERYIKLAEELENLTFEILNANTLQIAEKTSENCNAQLAL